MAEKQSDRITRKYRNRSHDQVTTRKKTKRSDTSIRQHNNIYSHSFIYQQSQYSNSAEIQVLQRTERIDIEQQSLLLIQRPRDQNATVFSNHEDKTNKK